MQNTSFDVVGVMRLPPTHGMLVSARTYTAEETCFSIAVVTTVKRRLARERGTCRSVCL